MHLGSVAAQATCGVCSCSCTGKRNGQSSQRGIVPHACSQVLADGHRLLCNVQQQVADPVYAALSAWLPVQAASLPCCQHLQSIVQAKVREAPCPTSLQRSALGAAETMQW